MLFALPTQVFSFVATETGSKAFRTGAGYTCRICPSLRWKERVFSSSLSRSLVAAPDIFSQSRIHPLEPAATKQSNQNLLSFPVNSSLPVYIYKTSSTRCLMRERFPWMQSTGQAFVNSVKHWAWLATLVLKATGVAPKRPGRVLAGWKRPTWHHDVDCPSKRYRWENDIF